MAVVEVLQQAMGGLVGDGGEHGLRALTDGGLMVGEGAEPLVVALGVEDLIGDATDAPCHRGTGEGEPFAQSAAGEDFLAAHRRQRLALAPLGGAVRQGYLDLDTGAGIFEQRIQGVQRFRVK